MNRQEYLDYRCKEIMRQKPMPKIVDPYNEVCWKIYKTALYRGDTLDESIQYIDAHDTLKKKFNKEYRVTFHKFKKWYGTLNERQINKLNRQHKRLIDIYYNDDKFVSFCKGTY